MTLVVPIVLGVLGRYCTVAAHIIPGHHNLQYLQKQCSLNPVGSCVKLCLHSHDGQSTSEAEFASGAYKRPYETD